MELVSFVKTAWLVILFTNLSFDDYIQWNGKDEFVEYVIQLEGLTKTTEEGSHTKKLVHTHT
jgi:hypothetical protein